MLHPFPNPRELFDASPKGRAHVSDFAVFYPHDKHQELITASLDSVARPAGTRASPDEVESFTCPEQTT